MMKSTWGESKCDWLEGWNMPKLAEMQHPTSENSFMFCLAIYLCKYPVYWEKIQKL